jgi:adenine-specific DNA-methyltransferase
LLRRRTRSESWRATASTRFKTDVKDGELIVTGERQVTEKTEGLGGELKFCTLGEVVEMGRLLTGKTLPAFDQLGALLFHKATNEARPIAAEPEQVAGCGYLGSPRRCTSG